MVTLFAAACGGGAKSARVGDGAPPGGGGAPPPPGGSLAQTAQSCEAAGEHVSTIPDGLSKKPITADQTKMGKLAYVERCTEDKWSTELQACFIAATTRDAIGACRNQMPKEQRSALRKDLRERLGRTHTGDEPAGGGGTRGVNMSADPCEGGE